MHEIGSLKMFLHLAVQEKDLERLKMATTTNKGDRPTGLANLPICIFIPFPLRSYFVLSWEVVCLSKALFVFLVKTFCQHSAKWYVKRGRCTFHGFYHLHFFTW